MKYADLILQTKEEGDKKLAPARANEQAARLGIAIAELDVAIQGAKNELEGLKGSYPLDVEAIVDAGDELDLQERRKAQLEALKSELFG